MRFLKSVYKVSIAVAGVAAMFEPTLAIVAGSTAVASVISSSVKDKNVKTAMKILNVIACNIDRAENAPLKNI